MARKKQIKRLLAFLLIFVMVIPIVSFATSGDEEDTTDTEVTETEDTEEEASETDADATDTDAISWEEVLEDVQSSMVVDSKQDEIKGHTFLCENDKFELYVKEENLSILIRCKDNGAVIESTADETEYTYETQLADLGEGWQEFFDSGVVIQVLYETETNRFASAATSTRRAGAKNAKLTYSYGATGFTCHVNYTEYAIEFDVQVNLTDEGIEYSIPGDSLVEGKTASDGTTYYLMYMYPFPMMAKSMIDSRDGYMILPDGNGITVSLENNNRKYTSPWYSRVYGRKDDDIGLDTFDASISTLTVQGRTYDTSSDTEKATLPIYGMVFTDTEVGVLCSIDDGDYSAMLYGNMNGAQNHYWNYACVRFAYRETISEKQDAGDSAGTLTVMQDDCQIEDVKATFIITTGDEADYAGLAVAYREHLLANGSLVEGADTSYNTRIQVLANDVEDFLVMKRDVTMTTVDQLEEIVNNLVAAGADDLLVIYEGWQSGGLYDLPIKKYNVDSSVGSKSELADLYTSLAKQGINLVLTEDAITINADTSSTLNAIKKIDKSTYTDTTYGQVYSSFKVLYPSVTQSNVISLATSMQKYDINSIGLSGISNQLFGYSRKSIEYSRLNTMTYFSDTLAELESMGMFIALEQPYSYLWKYTDAYLDLPLSTSGYSYETESIPFISIVLKGIIPTYSEYVNYEANSSEFFLKLAETGTYPSFYQTYESPSALENTNSDGVYSSHAEAFVDQIAEYSEIFGYLASKTDGAVITDHEIDGNVTITTYSNGIKVYVNYGSARTVDDEIGAMIAECFSIYDTNTGSVLATYQPD